MKTRRKPARRVYDEVVNESVSLQGGLATQRIQVPQGEQVHIVDQVNDILVVPPDMTKEEIR